MFTVRTVDMLNQSETDVATFDNYADAVAYADSIKTEPVYYRPDPDGVYVTIYDEDHDSPRYTSW